METLLKILGLIALFILLALLTAWPTQLLWNWLMPVIFGLTKITFWQALGINLLTGTLFRTSYNKSK